MSYEEYASDLSSFYEAREPDFARALADAAVPGGAVLDIGCGSGRDSAELIRRGFNATGLEPSEAMRAEAVRRHPELKGRLVAGALPALALSPEQERSGFDAILCNAALQHLESGELVPAFARVKELLRPGGLLAFSVPLSYPVDERGIDELGRYYNLRPRPFWIDLIRRFGLDICSERIVDDPGRPDRSWLQLFCSKPAGRGLLPLDTIASILARDTKTTTYKFALLRALAELAMTGAGRCEWREKEALIPFADIVDLWIEYYYPLVNHGAFIPQGRPTAGGGNDIAFRPALRELGKEFAQIGGLFALRRALRTPKGKVAIEPARKIVERALRNGPVVYSGSARTGGKLFRAEGEHLVLDAELWMEFGRFSAWIRDAAILRWAEFTKSLIGDRKGQSAGAVLDLLLPDEPIREQGDYRSLMNRAGKANPASIWTGRPLGKSIDIDHAIPFSLWGNNDLWNLFPVNAGENRAKSDKLPSLELMSGARERACAHWAFLDRERTDQFRSEIAYAHGIRIERWDGRTAKTLFDAFASAVELTAQAAGGERWEG